MVPKPQISAAQHQITLILQTFAPYLCNIRVIRLPGAVPATMPPTNLKAFAREACEVTTLGFPGLLPRTEKSEDSKVFDLQGV